MYTVKINKEGEQLRERQIYGRTPRDAARNAVAAEGVTGPADVTAQSGKVWRRFLLDRAGRLLDQAYYSAR